MFFRRTNRWQAVCDSLRERPSEWKLSKGYGSTLTHISGIEVWAEFAKVKEPAPAHYDVGGAPPTEYEKRCMSDAIAAWTCRKMEATDAK